MHGHDIFVLHVISAISWISDFAGVKVRCVE